MQKINLDFLDNVQARILDGDVFDSVNFVATEMTKVRLGSQGDYWAEQLLPAISAHPIREILQLDPYTDRALRKPRGYAGDAVMLDYVYFGKPPLTTSELGVQIFNTTTVSPGAMAVKWRAEFLGRAIDEIADLQKQANILSLACGHLREAEYSAALRTGRFGTIYAVDQDAESIEVVKRDYGHLPVQTRQATVKDVLKGTVSPDSLHLAYAAGLYDYLPAPVAQLLSAALFAMLSPGGRLVVPNFLTTNPVRGYMEAFMDWVLILRNQAEIESIGSRIPAEQVASRRYFEDPYGVVGYLEITKRG